MAFKDCVVAAEVELLKLPEVERERLYRAVLDMILAGRALKDAPDAVGSACGKVLTRGVARMTLGRESLDALLEKAYAAAAHFGPRLRRDLTGGGE